MRVTIKGSDLRMTVHFSTHHPEDKHDGEETGDCHYYLKRIEAVPASVQSIAYNDSNNNAGHRLGVLLKTFFISTHGSTIMLTVLL